MLRYLNPVNYVRRAYRLGYARVGFDRQAIDAAEETAFRAAHLGTEAALARLNQILAKSHQRTFDFSEDSIHWLVFAALSVARPGVKRVLELGTFDGEFTAILAQLFPEAEVVTVDLPDSDPLLRQFYGRGNEAEYERYVATQTRNVKAPNVHQLRLNSCFLLDHVQGPFDLTWVDAGHLYPEVAWDLANAHHLTVRGGLLLCDDVLPYRRRYEDEYVSTDSHYVLRYLSQRTDAPLHLFLKRRNPRYHAFRGLRKYVGMLERR